MKPKSLPEVVELLRSLPSGTSLDAAAVAAWLSPLASMEGREPEPGAPEPAVDLTVQQVARRFGRGDSTVRTWLAEGRFPNAYRLMGREWRVPVGDVEAMQHAEATRYRESLHKPEPLPENDEPDMSSWRRHLRAGAA